GAADTDNDNILEIVDGWRRPLHFIRFAWNNIDPVAQTDDLFPALWWTNVSGAPLKTKTVQNRSTTSTNVTIESTNPTPTSKYGDPLDTTGILANASWQGTPYVGVYQTQFGYTINNPYYNAKQT